MAKKSILLVDPHPLIQYGLSYALSDHPAVNVSVFAAAPDAVFQMIGQTHPDMVVMELHTKEGDGMQLLREVKSVYPELPVLIFSVHDEMLYAIRAVQAGASGYVMKHERTEVLLDAIRHVLSGEIYLSQSVEKRLRARAALYPSSCISPDALSHREMEVFELLGQGLATRQIAAKLGVSIKTVEAYYANIKVKLKLSNARELIRYAIHWKTASPSIEEKPVHVRVAPMP